MKYDYVSLYNKNAAFFIRRPTMKAAIKWGNLFLTAVFPIAYAFLLINAFFIEPINPKDAAVLLCLPLVALITVSVMRLMIDRPRPYEENGANITPLFLKAKSGHSFPSRHLASAAVISLVFASQFLAGGIVLLLFALLLGYARFTLGWHYPSDLLAGFGVGAGIGLLVFLL